MWTLDAETRWRYVDGMTRLSVWYVRLLLERGEVRGDNLAAALCRRVDLYRLTGLWDGNIGSSDGSADDRWLEKATKIALWLRSTPMDAVDGLETQVVRFLQPTLQERLPRDVGPPPTRPYGCWTYEPGWSGLSDRPGRLGQLFNGEHVVASFRKALGLPPVPSRNGVLHIMNVMVPQSPFEDMPQLARSLRMLLAQLRSEHPHVRELWCNTWLNEHPRFHDLFPEIWFRNAVVSPPGNYRNWWGQFARRDGDFNATAARQFRASGGQFPFRALRCHASLDAIEKHLAQAFDRPRRMAS